jgi:hypothetical protein
LAAAAHGSGRERTREARLRLERIERQLLPRAAVTRSPLRRLFYLFSGGVYPGASREKPDEGAAEQSAAFATIYEGGSAEGRPNSRFLPTVALISR